jgi:predicted metal-dependent enzyme (double-stranded beta helix superfamily)
MAEQMWMAVASPSSTLDRPDPARARRARLAVPKRTSVEASQLQWIGIETKNSPSRYEAPQVMPDVHAARRERACAELLHEVHAITSHEGITPSALHAIRLKLVALARRTDLFPLSDFAMPEAQGRNHPLLVEENDGHGLYLTIALPGKEAAPHDHGIWCVNAAISGRERHILYRRTDNGQQDGRAEIVQVGEVIVEPGNGMAMSDHDIHATEVVGDEPAIGLALYGYALARFPSVVWYHPAFGSTRASPSRRHAA